MTSSLDNRVLTGTILAAGLSSFAIYKYLKNKKSVPTKWRHAGVLSDLTAFPIKSCGGITLEMAECTQLGLKYGWIRDRAFMVTRNGKFITAREFPTMVMVKTDFQADKLTLSHPEMPTIVVDMSEVVKQETVTSYVWSEAVPTQDCGVEASKWFTKLLYGDNPSVKLNLVYYATEGPVRPVEGRKLVFKILKGSDVGAFPDMASFMFMNQASIDDLNGRIGNGKIKHNQLRANFLMSNGVPYEEDNFKWIKIGSNVFQVVEPCTRCVMTNIDAETGQPNPQSEPLNTLRKYRQIEDPIMRRAAGTSPVLGIFIALRSEPGVIHVGDPIYVA